MEVEVRFWEVLPLWPVFKWRKYVPFKEAVNFKKKSYFDSDTQTFALITLKHQHIGLIVDLIEINGKNCIHLSEFPTRAVWSGLI